MGFSFKVTRDEVSPALGRLAAAARNPTEVLRAMGTTFKSITEGTFNSVGASYRPSPWAPKYDGSASILQSRHPTLSKSFHLEVSSTGATLSNPMPYAAIHQFGGKTRPHKIVAKNKKGLAFKGIVRKSVNHPGSNIPARPFYPVTPDGKLTPAAEEKIAAAGKRVIEKQIGSP